MSTTSQLCKATRFLKWRMLDLSAMEKETERLSDVYLNPRRMWLKQEYLDTRSDRNVVDFVVHKMRRTNQSSSLSANMNYWKDLAIVVVRCKKHYKKQDYIKAMQILKVLCPDKEWRMRPGTATAVSEATRTDDSHN